MQCSVKVQLKDHLLVNTPILKLSAVIAARHVATNSFALRQSFIPAAVGHLFMLQLLTTL
jgi:hypothetical protein